MTVFMEGVQMTVFMLQPTFSPHLLSAFSLPLSTFPSRSVESSSEVAALSSDSRPAYCCPFSDTVQSPASLSQAKTSNRVAALLSSLQCPLRPSEWILYSLLWPHKQTLYNVPLPPPSVSVTPLIISGPASLGYLQVSLVQAPWGARRSPTPEAHLLLHFFVWPVFSPAVFFLQESSQSWQPLLHFTFPLICLSGRALLFSPSI